jgi:hypothetical protein
VLLPAALALALSAAPPPLRVHVELCEYEVAFDPSRITRERMAGFLRLLDPATGSWMGEMWDATPVSDLGSDEMKDALGGLEALLARFDAEMRRLEPPPSLDPVVRWVRGWITYELWRARALHDFCRTGDLAALRRPFGKLRPEVACAAALDAVNAKWFGKCEAARMRWGNCVNDALGAREFPRAAWDRFVKEHGIRLRKLECDEP